MPKRRRLALAVSSGAAVLAGALTGAEPQAGAAASAFSVREYRVPSGQHPHDVAPARDGGIWYTAQATGQLGWLDPKTGKTRMIPLGAGSAPHGVIVGPDGAPWITDGGLNAIVRVDPATRRVRRYPAAGVERLREPEHGNVRPPRHPLVHGAERDLRSARPAHGQAPRVLGSTRGRPVRHHHDPVRGRLLRVARRRLPRPHRCDRAAPCACSSRRRRPGRAQGVVRLAAAGSGSASGTPASSACSILGLAAGASGASPGRARCRTQSSSTSATPFG